MNIFEDPQIPNAVERRLVQLMAVYRDAQNRIENTIRRAGASDPSSFRLSEQLRQIKLIRVSLDKEAKKVAKETSPLCYKAGQDYACSALRLNGIDLSAPAALGTGVHTTAVQALADQMAYDLMSANGEMERGAVRLIRWTQQQVLREDSINKVIAQGVIEGASPDRVSKALLGEFEKKIKGAGKIAVNGKQFDADYYSRLVVRTRTREAVTIGTINTCTQYGVTLFQVSQHAEGDCKLCGPYEGRIFSTVPGTKYPVLEAAPPYHPNCKHVLVPYIEYEEA